jgi:DNA-binding NarL/FixJ family response regulator
MIIMVRAIMFDDNRTFRSNMQEYFEDSDKVYLAAAFANGEDAVAQVKKHQPDVVLMDIQMPGTSGIEALRKIKAVSPNTKVVMLTSFDDDDKILAAICNGASGYLMKGENLDNVENAISDIEKGGANMTPSIARKAMEMFQKHMVKGSAEYVHLTKRQKEVLTCLVNGMSYKMISAHLNVGYETVCDHIQLIYKKLHVNSATEAVREAIHRKLV